MATETRNALGFTRTTAPAGVHRFRRDQTGDREWGMREHDGVVHHIMRRHWGSSVTRTEALQEGHNRLSPDILRFDPAQGAEFAPYDVLSRTSGPPACGRAPTSFRATGSQSTSLRYRTIQILDASLAVDWKLIDPPRAWPGTAAGGATVNV